MGTCETKLYKQLTPREWWIQEIFGSRTCDACGAKPVEVVAHVTLPQTRISLSDPVGLMLGKYGDRVAYRRTLTVEPHYAVGQHAACRGCKKAMEQMLAVRTSTHGDYGSSAHIQWDRAPEDRLILLAS
jgi:hypothetical protein